MRIAATLLWADIPSRDMVAATEEQWAVAALAANCEVPNLDCRKLAVEFLNVLEVARNKVAAHFAAQFKEQVDAPAELKETCVPEKQ